MRAAVGASDGSITIVDMTGIKMVKVRLFLSLIKLFSVDTDLRYGMFIKN